jgi:hypothetical protein
VNIERQAFSARCLSEALRHERPLYGRLLSEIILPRVRRRASPMRLLYASVAFEAHCTILSRSHVARTVL